MVDGSDHSDSGCSSGLSAPAEQNSRSFPGMAFDHTGPRQGVGNDVRDGAGHLPRSRWHLRDGDAMKSKPELGRNEIVQTLTGFNGQPRSRIICLCRVLIRSNLRWRHSNGKQTLQTDIDLGPTSGIPNNYHKLRDLVFLFRNPGGIGVWAQTARIRGNSGYLRLTAQR